VAAVAESATQPGQGEAWEGLHLAEVGDVRRDEVPFELDTKLTALCQERGPLRAVLARIAFRLVSLSAWKRLGYARLSDYAAERLGISARSVRSLAEVGVRLGRFPLLEDALVSGTLGWTKVRLLVRLLRDADGDEDEAAWIAHALGVTAEELSREVRKVDRGSVEAGAADEATERSRRFEVSCSAEVRSKWHGARGAARRVAGRMLHPSEAAELIAAEVLSAVPIDETADLGSCEEAGVSWSEEKEPEGDTAATAVRPPWREKGAESARPGPLLPRPSLPPALEPLLEGLAEADAFDVDERFRRALSMEQRLEARIGPLLVLVWERWVYRALGYRTQDAYARERLGMDPTRARALVRLEHALVLNESFARTYRSGALSWVKASVLAPLVSADSLGWFVEEWVSWAGRVTVRRLREDVERALTLEETDPEAFRRGGGRPPEVCGDREIGAPLLGPEKGVVGVDREIGAPLWEQERHLDHRSAPVEGCSVRFFGPADIVQLFRAVLCTVRRRMERDDGRLPTEGEALGAMLDHVLASWDVLDGEEKAAARHRVFARDGWRCTVPGCTSMQNLHSHHIRFRSAQGSDAPENRTTLCTFHHLRGVHGGLLRCAGRAPDGLRWEMGIRPGVTPLLAYRSGDVRVPATGTQSSRPFNHFVGGQH
jgi:hypothetical protein